MTRWNVTINYDDERIHEGNGRYTTPPGGAETVSIETTSPLTRPIIKQDGGFVRVEGVGRLYLFPVGRIKRVVATLAATEGS